MAQLTKRAQRSMMSVSANGQKMVYLANDFTHLTTCVGAGYRAGAKVSNHNAALWSQLTAQVERTTYKGADRWASMDFW
jgi:hypothetical protein